MNTNSLPLNMDYFYTLNQSTCQFTGGYKKKVKSIPLYPHEYLIFLYIKLNQLSPDIFSGGQPINCRSSGLAKG